MSQTGSYDDVVEVDGVRRPLREWIETISYNYRTQYGRPVKLVPSFGTGRPISGKYNVNGVVRSLGEWAKMTGISKKSFRVRYARFLRGELTEEQVLSPRNDSYVRCNNGPGCRNFMIDGRLVSLEDLSREYGINAHTLLKRIYISGMSIEEAVSKPVRKARHNSSEEQKRIKEASLRLGLSKAAIYNRIKNGMSVDDATTIEKMDMTDCLDKARDASVRKSRLRNLSAIGVVV